MKNPRKARTCSRLRHIYRTVFLVLLATAAWAAPPSAGRGEEYLAVTGPCDLQFPSDHGPHPDARTEWWYYTGNLQSEDGKSFGFQLTFFRSRIAAPGTEKSWPRPASHWRSGQVYLAHAAVSDISGKRYLHNGTLSREAPGLAGSLQQSGATDISVRGWSAHIGPGEHRLDAAADRFRIALSLTPLKAPTLHGRSGYSLKGSTPERASCYYSFTRLDTGGTIVLNGKEIPVRGTSWMDHEFSSAPMEEDLAGWDWFSMQLSDGTELMVYLMRRKDGSCAPASSGTFVDASGKSVALDRESIRVDVLGHWRSPRSGALYPANWRLRVPSLGIDLALSPKLADQEMETPETTGVTYWEGSIAIAGKGTGGKPVEGNGYAELTGYAKSMDGRL
ncbi:MAG: lipocalin-like domain-containing protein [Syntrophobacteraceae bacterium]